MGSEKTLKDMLPEIGTGGQFYEQTVTQILTAFETWEKNESTCSLPLPVTQVYSFKHILLKAYFVYINSVVLK